MINIIKYKFLKIIPKLKNKLNVILFQKIDIFFYIFLNSVSLENSAFTLLLEPILVKQML